MEGGAYTLHVSNVGDTEVVLCRGGEAIPLSRLFHIHKDSEECQRICKTDGIITEVIVNLQTQDYIHYMYTNVKLA